jgi:GrpB-like predicted nucleotidyltransferase (UPF0157 family)
VVDVPDQYGRWMDTDGLFDFEVARVPAGASPWVEGFGPGADLTISDHDSSWPQAATEVCLRISEALGDVALRVDHVGSTSVPDLPAKPIMDVCVVVPDPGDEATYVPVLEGTGLVLVVREPWWQGHRMFRLPTPRANVHVFGPDAAEPVRMRVFRDWLRTHPADRDRYAAAKLAARGRR